MCRYFSLRSPKYANKAIPTKIPTANTISRCIEKIFAASSMVGCGVGDCVGVGVGDAEGVACAIVVCTQATKTKPRTSARAQVCFFIANSTGTLAFLSFSVNQVWYGLNHCLTFWLLDCLFWCHRWST